MDTKVRKEAMADNVASYFQWLREIDPQSYGLGGYGGKVKRFVELSDEEMVNIAAKFHIVEVQHALSIYSDKDTWLSKPQSQR